MKYLIHRLTLAFVLTLLLASPALLLASPGAHGPNGEHLDGPAAGAVAETDGRPRMEAFTEVFELVAHLEHDALAAMINIYETNAPVDGAEVELESNGVVAKGEFDPQTGIYRFDDPELIEALSEHGNHSLAFTVIAGEEFDIVAGAMDVEDDHGHEHAGIGTYWWLLIVALLLAVVAFVVLRRRRAGGRFAGVHP